MKKKGFIGLSTLLLVLLLGSFTVTYADSNRTWTEDEVKNVIYNYYKWEEEKTDSEIETFIDNNSTLITTITNKMNSTDNVIITHVGQQQSYGLVFVCSAHANPQFYQSSRNGNNFLNVNNRNGNDIFYYCNYQFGTGSRTNLADISSTKYFNTFLYTSTPIRSASPTGTILFNIGYTTPTNMYNGPYNKMEFILLPEETNTRVDVDIFEDIPAYEYSVGENVVIGTLYVPNEIQITDFSLLRGYYTGDYWKYIEVTTQYPNSYIYYNKWTEDEEWKSYEVIFNRQYIQQNNIYIITWWDQREEPYKYATGTFYIKNGQTVIQNGTVIPSGDKITGAIGELQEDINSNNDFWKETYDKLFTIDSGDAEEIIANFLESSNLGEYGLESGELAILGILNGEPSDFIISWNSVIIPNLKNNDPTTLIPPGSINFSKVEIIIGEDYYTLDPSKLATFQLVIGWVQLILGFAVVLLTIANVWETLMRALGVGVGMYEDNMEEKETLMNIDVDSGEIRTTEIRRVPTQKYTYFLHRKH